MWTDAFSSWIVFYIFLSVFGDDDPKWPWQSANAALELPQVYQVGINHPNELLVLSLGFLPSPANCAKPGLVGARGHPTNTSQAYRSAGERGHVVSWCFPFCCFYDVFCWYDILYSSVFFPVAYNITCCHTRCIPTTSYNIVGSPHRLLSMVRSHDRLSCVELRRHYPATCASPTPKEGKIYASKNGIQTVLSVLSIIDLTICCGLWIGPSRNHSHLMPPPPYLDGV